MKKRRRMMMRARERCEGEVSREIMERERARGEIRVRDYGERQRGVFILFFTRVFVLLLFLLGSFSFKSSNFLQLGVVISSSKHK